MGQTEISNYQSAGIRKSFVYSAYIIISIALACALQLAINVVLSSLKTGYYLVFASYLLSTIFLLPVNSRCNLSGKVVFSIILGPAFALCIFGLIVNKYLFPLK